MRSTNKHNFYAMIDSMEIVIPGREKLLIKTVLLDLNGTIEVSGAIPYGVREGIEELQTLGIRVILFHHDKNAGIEKLANILGVIAEYAENGEQKLNKASKYDLKTAAAIGNGLDDLLIFQNVPLSIITLQSEGIALKSLQSADVLVSSINDAFDLFIDQTRLIATLRN